MRIGVNLLAFEPDRIGGLEHYVRRLLAALLETTAHRFVLFAPPAADLGFAEVPERLCIRRFAIEEGDFALTRAIAEERLDLWWCPWVVWRPLRPPVPSVVTIPDLQHERLPEAFAPEERRHRRVDYLVAAQCAHAVITFSNHARDDVRSRYGVPDDRVFAIALDAGYDWKASEPTPEVLAAMRASVGAGFLYYPANTWPHKDHETLLSAMSRLAAGGDPTSLVLTGAGDHDRGRLQRSIREQGLGDRVRVLGTLAPAQVRALYRLASAVVFPSRFEGFGMPLVEGMRSGVPVLSSDATSLPEVGGDAVAYFPAGDEADLADKIRRIVHDQPWRAELIRRGHERAALFSWKNTARATVDVFTFAVTSPAPDTPVATAIGAVAEGLLSQLAAAEADREARLELIQVLRSQLAVVEADREARLALIQVLRPQLAAAEADRAARLDVIERLVGRIREAGSLLEQAHPRSYHGLAWPWEVVRVRRTIAGTLQILRDLVS
jgi:glycosyltransferase involved in cell wall biosynthesis